MINTELAKHCYSSFRDSTPWQHIVFDNFILADVLQGCWEEVKAHTSWRHDPMRGYPLDQRESQINKFWYPGDAQTANTVMCREMPKTYTLLSYFNSSEFINFLETLTGITGLLPDLDFAGSGIHKITKGGRLEVHRDYLRHPKNPDLNRRLNLLLYMNPDWSYNGELELYKDRNTCFKKISPQFNRAVIFNTRGDALHGHPEPLEVPEGVERYSLALYYFTKEKPDELRETVGATWYKEHK
jgi:Rps23 Pro-64 3,4-dihydroxylase Tpa1-like proline 4-hydroxylase